MISYDKRKSGLIRRYEIVGGRRLSNYWWALVIFLGGCGFLITGVSSYYNKNLWTLPFFLFSPHGVDQVDRFQGVTQFLKKINPDLLSAQSVNDTMVQKIQNNLPFFPQGLVLCFYGVLGFCFSFHLWFTLIWQVGGGFNEFNKEEKSVRVFRWGRPGKNRRIDLKYSNESIEAIKVELAPRRALFLSVKGERNIPLTRIGEPLPLEEIEAQAAELASFLQIPLEMG